MYFTGSSPGMMALMLQSLSAKQCMCSWLLIVGYMRGYQWYQMYCAASAVYCPKGCSRHLDKTL